MEIGIFGLPLCGKTTLFTLLTGVEPSTSSRKVEAGVGVARVHDPRVEQLSAIFRPRKTIYATVTFVDLPSYDPAANRKEKNRILQFIQNSDALLAVVRAFADPAVPWPVGGEGPARQLASIKTELLLRDMEVVEGRLARLDEGFQKHRLTAEEDKERLVLQQVQQGLEEEHPVSQMGLAEDDLHLLGSLALFTAKPVIVAVNLDEQQFEAHTFPEKDALRAFCSDNGFALIELSGKVEAEIAALDPADRRSFMEVLGISESGIERLSAVVYDHVGLISFLTVGEDEVRAWTIRRGTNAKGAAGKIHTDLASHFIRAEIIPYTAFMEVGEMPAARSRGLIRTVGRDEIVHDGDIVNILANA